MSGEPVDADPRSGPQARVLLVDDDAGALRVTGMMLSRAGFQVTAAPGGDEAVCALDTAGPFDALVTDYAMPGLCGVALVELALQRQPSLPALVITGYGRESQLRRLPEYVGVLTKPFTRQELLRRVTALAPPADPAQPSAPGL